MTKTPIAPFVVCSVLLFSGCHFDTSNGLDPAASLGDEGTADAAAQLLPARHCQEILDLGRSTGDGNYTIDLDGEGAEPAFEVYCDMTTDGGGWTLVYAYTFSDYASFATSSNAVTPRPSWAFSNGTSVEVSTTAPQGVDDFNALEFSRWKDIGGTLFVQSNINHWIICDEVEGSLVNEIEGSVDCRIEKLVASACTTEVPATVHPDWSGRGPALNGKSHYYYWVGATNVNWPTHDPCGANQANQLPGVATPTGAIYLRP